MRSVSPLMIPAPPLQPSDSLPRPTVAAIEDALEGAVANVQDDGRRPFDEALLDTRTPAEFAVAPDSRTLAFALLATVDDVGRHFPSDLWLGGIEQPPVRLTEGHAPAWSPDGSRLAFLSDRITPGHQLPHVMALDGEPRLVATLHGSA